MARIVVGVGASRGALRALTWAADEPRPRLATLQGGPRPAEDRKAAFPARVEPEEARP